MTWGVSKFGGGLFGFAIDSVLAEGQIISLEIAKALVRELRPALEISSTITFDGVEEPLIRRWTVSRSEGSLYSMARVTVGTTDLTSLKGKVLEISQKIKFYGIGEIDVSKFRGVVSSSIPTTGAAGKGISLIAYDINKESFEGATDNLTWSSTASSLIADELATAGLTAKRISIEDFTVPSTASFAYSNLGIFLREFASSKGKADVFSLPSGEIIIQDRISSGVTDWEVGKHCQLLNSGGESPSSRFNQVVVQASDGSVETANDLSDQAIHGVLRGSQITTQFFTSSADLLAVGNNAIAESQANRVNFSAPRS